MGGSLLPMSVPVQIIRVGDLVRVPRVVFDAAGLSSILTYFRRLQSGANPQDAEFEKTELFAFDSDGCALVQAGLLPRMFTRMREVGYDPWVDDRRELVLPPPDYSKLDLHTLREDQLQMIAAIVANDRGILEGPTGSGKSFVIRQLCKMWPNANVIICSPVMGVLHTAVEELKTTFPKDQVGMCGDGFRDICRITCSTNKSLGYCNLDGCQLFIFDEVHRAAAPETSRIIAKVRNARRFGFSASPDGRSDLADLEAEAMFGTVIYRGTYQEAQARGAVVPIEVYMVSCYSVPNEEYIRTVALERNLLWRCAQRNQLIVSAVRWLQRQFGAEIQIQIIVAKVEHAVHLAPALPDFELVYGSMDAPDRKKWEEKKLIPKDKHPITSTEREEMRRAFHAGTLRRVISTHTWGTGVDFPHLGAVIRADGGSGKIDNIQLSGRVTRPTDDKRVGIIVDFDDVNNRRLSARAKKRMGTYKGKGWKITSLRLN